MNLHIARFSCFAAVLTLVCLSAAAVFAQSKTDKSEKAFCGNYSNYNDKVSFSEAREFTLPANGSLNVDGERNGGVKIIGGSRADILVKACVQTAGETNDAARRIAENITIEKSSNIRAANSGGETSWGVSYEIYVPRQTNLSLTARNGGISIANVEGTLEFTTQNGGVNLSNLAGDVRGTTRNGGLHVELTGGRWRGAGLDVETKNGGVHLDMPENYAARIETGTVNGGFKSDFPALNAERGDRSRALRINTDLNGGGAPVRIVTTNGGIKINSAEKSQL